MMGGRWRYESVNNGSQDFLLIDRNQNELLILRTQK